MKKLFVLIFALFVAFGAMAQKGTLKTLNPVVLNGAVTVTSDPVSIQGTYETLSFGIKCNQLGGTSDGTVSVLASNDGTNYFNLNAAHGYPIYGSPLARVSDSTAVVMQIYPAATLNIVLKPAHRYYKLTASGTASDTTSLAITWVYK